MKPDRFFQSIYFRCGILIALWAAIYLGSLSSPALFDDADTVHAEAVREMVESGDWITLRINNGIRYLEKSPLMYWVSAASVSLFGLSDWAVRLPIALFTLMLTLLLHRFGDRFFGGSAGFYSALIYVTSLGPFAFTRILLPDVILTFFLTLSFYFYLRILLEPEPASRLFGKLDWRCVGIYVSVALAVLTKGLIGVIFTGLVILAHMALSGRWDMWRRLQILPGIGVFLIVAAPWHLAAGFTNKGFFWFYFINEHFLRYLGMRYPKDYDTVPRWLFWTLHLAWLFPWSAFFRGLGRIFPKALRPESPTARANMFLFLWMLLILIFFSFSTTQEYYTFPTLPAFCLLLGQVLAHIDSPEGASLHRKALAGLGVLSVAGVMAGGGLFVLAWLGKGAGAAAADLNSTLTVNTDKYALSFGHIHDLTPATFGHLYSLVSRTAAIILVCPLLALGAAIRRRWQVTAVVLGIMMAGLLNSYHGGMVAFEPVLSSRSLAQVIKYHHQPGDEVVINGRYEKGSTINYYAHLRVSILNGHWGNLWYGGSFFPDAHQVFHDDASFLEAWYSNRRLFLFSEAEPLAAFLFRHPDFKYRVLAHEGGKKVLVNW